MKKILITLCMLFIVNAQASIEHDPNQKEATPAEIAKSRSCFEELEQNGCGDGEDHKQFRSCLQNVFSSLTPDCQTMMSRLYGIKK